MSTEDVFAPAAPAPARSRRLPVPALAVAGAGALLTVVAVFLTWVTASVTVAGETQTLTLVGTDEGVNGTFTLVIGIIALAVVGLLAWRPVRGLWLLLPLAGALVVLLVWASTVKVQRTIEEISALTSGAGADVSSLVSSSVENGLGLWVTLAGGILLLATAVLVPVLRRR